MAESNEGCTKSLQIDKFIPNRGEVWACSTNAPCGCQYPLQYAEGAARQGKKEFKNFLSMGQRSLSELDTQLELSVSLGFLDNEVLKEITNQLLRIDKMLTGLIRSLQK